MSSKKGAAQKKLKLRGTARGTGLLSEKIEKKVRSLRRSGGFESQVANSAVPSKIQEGN